MLLVPLRDSEGKLWSLQRSIRWQKDIPQKWQVKRLFYTIGTPTQKHILTEGYATAAVYESTGMCATLHLIVGTLKR